MDSIAIVGIGCRFPGANSPEAFWQLLINGEDAVSEVPAGRWRIDEYYTSEPATPGKMSTQLGGYLKQPVDEFDAEFFNISPTELENIDPQQRLMLEVAWEAIEQAGIAPDSLSGSKTGVYVGMSTIDYHRYLYQHPTRLNAYSGTGTSPCIAANRVSFQLNFRGPSFSLDSACSSSLLAVHLACQSLRSRESEMCLAGGVNLMLAPEPNIQLSQGRMLATDGRCKVFDASADGYGRGEGCGVILLKRLEDALADGDTVLAVIEGIAVNQDGLSNGLTSPNGTAQEEVIEAALSSAGIEPAQVSYVESHAVGTPLGDAIELKSLTDVLMKNREVEQPCWVGSVKTNIGHLEAAAGMAAIIKVVLSLQHEKIPANLHFNELNPYISKKKSAIAFPQSPQDWPRSQVRFAGVSAFSYGGTNCHLVMSSGNSSLTVAKTDLDNPVTSATSYHLLTLSAKSQQALEALVQRYRNLLQSQSELSLADICFTANTGRSHFDYRVAFISESVEVLSRQLASFLAKSPATGIVIGQATKNKRKKIGYRIAPSDLALFQLGFYLYQTQTVFRQSIEYCESYLTHYWDQPVGNLLEMVANKTFSETLNQPMPSVLGVVVGVAIGELWKSWGIRPAGVVGYGSGKYVAAALSGVVALEETLKLLVTRIQASKNMACGSAESTTKDTFRAAVGSLHYLPSKIKWISEVSGELMEEETVSNTSYWQNDSLQAVDLFSVSLSASLATANPVSIEAVWNQLGCEPILEISGGLEVDRTFSLGSHTQACWANMLQQLASLYITGASVNWRSFYNNFANCAAYQRVQLPTYPFQRKRHWFDPSSV